MDYESDSERVENEELLDEIARDGDGDNCECGAGEDNREEAGRLLVHNSGKHVV